MRKKTLTFFSALFLYPAPRLGYMTLRSDASKGPKTKQRLVRKTRNWQVWEIHSWVFVYTTIFFCLKCEVLHQISTLCSEETAFSFSSLLSQEINPTTFLPTHLFDQHITPKSIKAIVIPSCYHGGYSLEPHCCFRVQHREKHRFARYQLYRERGCKVCISPTTKSITAKLPIRLYSSPAQHGGSSCVVVILGASGRRRRLCRR